MTYMLDNLWKRERERLDRLEAYLDPQTIRRLEAIGVAEGWRCLEVGGGGGSIAQWLCKRVGPGGRVCATDIETKFLEALGEPNLEVRRHDIVADSLEQDAFDLVHARAVLEHLPGRETALEKVVLALKRGGWLLLEEGDQISVTQVTGGQEELFQRIMQLLLQFLSFAGFDPYYGRNLGCLLRNHGLVDVQFEGHVGEMGGSRPETSIYLLVIEKIRDRAVSAGIVNDRELDQFLSLLQQPDFCAISRTVFGAWGRRPG